MGFRRSEIERGGGEGVGERPEKGMEGGREKGREGKMYRRGGH